MNGAWSISTHTDNSCITFTVCCCVYHLEYISWYETQPNTVCVGATQLEIMCYFDGVCEPLRNFAIGHGIAAFML